MNEIKIRRATMEDLAVLKVFEQGVIEAERPFDSTIKDSPVNYYDLEEMITADHIEFLVAEVEGRLIGSGYARMEEAKPYNKHAHYAYLGFMYVVPEYRGKGVNNLLINGLKTWAASKNLTEIRLQVYEDNEPAIKAYHKAGFTKHMVEMRLEITE